MFDEKNAFQKTNFRALILVLVYKLQYDYFFSS